MSRIGILGGSFNPPHVGHLLMAQEAHWQLGLDRVVLMPVAEPPHKRIEDDPGADERLELCRLAADGDDRLAVSGLEVERGGPSFTVETLRQIHAAAPGDELTFIVGGDMAHSLPAWREPEAVLEMAALAVAEREEIAREAIAGAVAGLAGAERLTFFAMPRIDVSSSEIRRRVREGLPIRYLVPGAVERVIAARGFYRESVSA